MKWISVKDRLPPIQDKLCLVLLDGETVDLGYYWKGHLKGFENEEYWILERGTAEYSVTHWMSLDFLPKVTE